MSEPTTKAPSGVFDALASALAGELEQLRSARQSLTLFGGTFVGSFAGHYYYRFEVAEDAILPGTEKATFTFGATQPISAPGNIITLDNQYLTVAVPRNFGPLLPEVRCEWRYDEHLQPIIEKVRTAASHPVAETLFNLSDPHNRHAVPFEAIPLPQTPPEQLEAVKRILQNRVTLLWGPIRSGKTHVLSLTAAAYLNAGKRVLYVTPLNDEVDDTLLKTVETGKELGLDMQALAARVDLPSLVSAEAIAPYSFEHRVEQMKEEKRKIFQERVTLLAAYWRIRTKQILHEDYYAKVKELREKQTDLRKQVDQMNKEIEQLRDGIARIQSASMIERLKKGMGKDDMALAQKQLGDKQVVQKRLVAIQQALANEITKWDLNAPVTGAEVRELNIAMKRIDELGGVEAVTKAVDDFVAVDTAALMHTKTLVATSVQAALLDNTIAGASFDLVIVDEAHMVNLPTLAALATLATEKMLVAGDPFQMEPESLSTSEHVQRWLQRDIYLHAAQREDLHGMFDWSAQHAQWSIALSSQFASTPKLSVFAASVLYDDKVNVFVSPKAKGKIYFIDTSEFGSRCKQYVGRKKILPCNEFHSKRVLECVKHALMEPGRSATDVGVMFPFSGPTLYQRHVLRSQGVENVEVGTPQSFRGRRKKAIVFDTTMAGVDYTMRSIDDKKIGEHRIARLFNTLFSSVGEDLYVIADVAHFRQLYKDRLFTRLLMLLQAEADQKQPAFGTAVKKFDDLEPLQRTHLLSLSRKEAPAMANGAVPGTVQAEKRDYELELKMKMLANKQASSKPLAPGERNYERDITAAALRVLGGRVDVNLLSQYVGGDVLFRNSIATEFAARRLPHDFCQNEKDFREIMERWNMLIYEMSGGNKTDLSYFAQRGPETRIRENIHHLKAFYSSDVEAVIEQGKQKIAVEVSKIFQELLGKSQPNNPAEWSSAYLGFLGRLDSYLVWISEQLRR